MLVIVCSCQVVSDRTVQAAVASGATTIEEVAARCGAGARCGGCWPALRELIDAHAPAPREQRTTSAA